MFLTQATSQNWKEEEEEEEVVTVIFWISPNLAKYIYGWLPLKQHDKIGL
jgi:hypothetical protein